MKVVLHWNMYQMLQRFQSRRNTPSADKLDSKTLCSVKKIFCDIETTSLHSDADIIQIAAVSESDSFDCYIIPPKAISQSASDITGLNLYRNNMFYHGQRVNPYPLANVLTLFVDFMPKHEPCVLIGTASTYLTSQKLSELFSFVIWQKAWKIFIAYTWYSAFVQNLTFWPWKIFTRAFGWYVCGKELLSSQCFEWCSKFTDLLA